MTDPLRPETGRAPESLASHEPGSHQDAELVAAVRRAFSAYRAPARDVAERPARRAALRRFALARRPLAALSATAGVAVVLVVAVLLAQSLARPQSAFASWTAVPGSPDPALGRVAEQDCRRLMDESPPADAERSGSSWPIEQRAQLGALGDASTLPLVALDQRGSVALALFSDGHTFASCLVMASGATGSTAVAVGAIERPRPGVLRVLSGIAYLGEPPLRMVIGDLASEVAAVTIVREDGVSVSATVTDGYFLAWWPADSGIASIVAYDAAGNTLDTAVGDIFD